MQAVDNPSSLPDPKGSQGACHRSLTLPSGAPYQTTMLATTQLGPGRNRSRPLLSRSRMLSIAIYSVT
jgi:hypothetical protein